MISLKFLFASIDIFCLILVSIIVFLTLKGGSLKDSFTRRFFELLVFQILGILCEISSYQFAYFKMYLALKICYFLIFAIGCSVLVVFLKYLIAIMEAENYCEKGQFVVLERSTSLICASIILLCLINLFFPFIFDIGDVNGKSRFIMKQSTLYLFVRIIPLGLMALASSIIIFSCRCPLKIRFSSITYIVFPILALIFENNIRSGSVKFIGSTLSIMMIFAQIQESQKTRIAIKEKGLIKDRISIMISQIQPHFLYNALSAMSMLCDEKPESVKPLLSDFSKYLRCNLDSLRQTAPVPFEKEMEHVNIYLKFEKIRFEEKIHVEYDISALDFMIPSLSIQPLVENAVRHGLCTKDEGGIIKISTKETEKSYIIEVSDDGVGFNPDEINSSRESHGLDNVRHRVQEMMNGSLDIESHTGKGSRVTITIPRRRI